MLKKSLVSLSAIMLVTVLCFSCKSCFPDPDPVVDKVTLALNDAITALNQNSSDWQRILTECINKLPPEVQSTIKVEVSNVLSRGIAASGSEFRCNTDFIGNRMKYALEAIKSQYLGSPIPAQPPQLCSVIPLAVDLALVPERINVVEFYGYDFDHGDTKVLLDDGARQVDVTSYLNKPTHYHMTLNIGANGVKFSENSTQIIVNTGNDLLATIAVIQKPVPICQTQVVRVTPGSVDFIPPRVRGDAEFDGHGPKVFCLVSVKNNRSTIDANIYMRAKEVDDRGRPKKDYTTAEGNKSLRVYTAPSGWVVNKLLISPDNSITYTDSNHEQDIFTTGAGGPVNRFEFTGDTAGDDAGIDTKVRVVFNNFQIELKQTGACITRETVRTLRLQKNIRTMIIER